MKNGSKKRRSTYLTNHIHPSRPLLLRYRSRDLLDGNPYEVVLGLATYEDGFFVDVDKLSIHHWISCTAPNFPAIFILVRSVFRDEQRRLIGMEKE